MGVIKDLRHYCNEVRSNKESILVHALIICSIFLVSLHVKKSNYAIFHIAIEIYTAIVGIVALIIILNSYKTSKKSAFLILGVGYGFAGIFNLMHGVTSIYGTFSYFNVSWWNASSKLWVSAEYILVISQLYSFILIYKEIEVHRVGVILGIYIGVSILILLSIFYWGIFPGYYTDLKDIHTISFTTITAFFIMCMFVFTVIVLFKSRNKVDCRTFIFLEISLIFILMYDLLSAVNIYGYVIGHLFKLISFYFVYKAIVEVALKKPYECLEHNLQEKTVELNDTNEKLSAESQQRIYVEKAFMENEDCYNLLIENAQDSILIHSQGKIVFANLRTARLIGLSTTEELIGVSILGFITGKVKEVSTEYIDKGYGKESIHPCIQTKLITSSGQELDVEIRSTFLYYKNKPSVLCIIRDISSEKQVEKLKLNVKEKQEALDESREVNKSLTEFFANISHELRTPLNVLLSSVQVMDLYNRRREEDYDRSNRYLKTMKQNCYRLQRLVNNLIDVSKIDSGYLELNLCNNNIVSTVEDITLSVAEYTQNKGVTLIFDTDTEEKMIAFDSDIIERIILNLLSNAIKFTDSGDEIMVSIIDGEDNIFISVRDSGIGIPKDKLQTIFERFKQVDKSLKRKREGSGIGLSLVKALVELHGGTMGVESEIGRGTEFTIELPVRIVDDKGGFKNAVYDNSESKVERIQIEFSDIYS